MKSLEKSLTWVLLPALTLLPSGSALAEPSVSEQAALERRLVEPAVQLRSWSIALEGSVDTAPFASNAGRLGVGLAIHRTQGSGWVALLACFGADSYRGQALSIQERSGRIELSGGWRWLLTPLVFHVGLSAGLDGYRQSFIRDQQSYFVQQGYGSVPAALALGMAIGPVVALQFPIWRRLFAWLDLGTQARYLPIGGESAWSVGAGLHLGVGWQI